MDAFTSFADAFHDHFSRDPNVCVSLGVAAHLDELPDPTLAGVEVRLAEARELLARLDGIDGIDRASLSFDQDLDLDLARLALEAEIWKDSYTFNGHTRLAQLPTAGDDIGDGIFMMFINDPRPAEERLANITARIAEVPGYVEGLLGRLSTPVKRWVDIDLEKVGELPSLFATLQGWADEVGYKGAAELSSAREAACAALESYRERLAALPTTTQIHAGHEAARRIIANNGIDLSLDELHGIARDFLSETNGALEELRGRLVAKYGLAPETTVEELHAFLNARYRVKVAGDDMDAVLDRYRRERGRILAFIEERDLFPVFEDQDMLILRTPRFMEPSIPAGAMVSPAPFRPGTKTSLVYLTLSPELLDEHTELGIPMMMVHEGIPGHHLQLATAATHSSVIRRHMSSMDQAEGWTTMLEDYMLDVGYMGELSDEARFSGKRDISRIGARVAIDLFLMTGDRTFLDVGVPCDTSSDDPFVAAGNLLQAVTGFVTPRVQAELNWYSIERGYPLSYLSGNRLVWALKRDVAAAQKGRLEGMALDREFHRVFLQSGNMPVRFLRRVFEERGLLSTAR